MVYNDVKYSPVATDESPRTGGSCLAAMLGAAPSFRNHVDYSVLPTNEEETTTPDTADQPHSAGYWEALKSAAASCRASAALYTSVPQDDTETRLSNAGEQSFDSMPSGGNSSHSNDHCLDMSCAEEMEEHDDHVLHPRLIGAGDTQPLIYDHTFKHKPPTSPLHARVHTTCRYIRAQIRTTDHYVRTTLHTSKGYASDKMRTLMKISDPLFRWSLRGSRPWLLLCLVLGVASISISALALTRTNGFLLQEEHKDEHQTHLKLKKLESDFYGKLEEGHEISRKAHEKIDKMNSTLHDKVEKGIISSAQAHEKIDQLEKDFDAKLDGKHRTWEDDVNAVKSSLSEELQKERQVSRQALDRISQLEASMKDHGRAYFGNINEHTMIYILSAVVLLLVVSSCSTTSRLNDLSHKIAALS